MEVQNQNIRGGAQHSEANPDREAYKMAQIKVEKLKNFYIHLIVYLFVNAFLIFSQYTNLDPGEAFTFRPFSTAFFWGIGLVAHGFSVFIPHFAFGKDWEERKVKELMDKRKNNNWE